uniref:Uncharacterized protein n=1 Tax=Chlamydomonas euryale TaxID=1486919 RepID=A0A7R9V5C8_9CHLO
MQAPTVHSTLPITMHGSANAYAGGYFLCMHACMRGGTHTNPCMHVSVHAHACRSLARMHVCRLACVHACMGASERSSMAGPTAQARARRGVRVRRASHRPP